MKLYLFPIVALFASQAYAQSSPLLETTENARMRHNAERYETYKQNNYQAPLGGYSERLGDPAPHGTDRPGYASPQPYGGGNNNNSGNTSSPYGKVFQ